MDVKPGWKTTEFWGSVAAMGVNVVALLVALGRVDPSRAADLSAAVVAGVGALGVAVANAAILWGYVRGRAEVKVASLEVTQMVAQSRRP